MTAWSTTGARLSEQVQVSDGIVGFGVAMVSNGGTGEAPVPERHQRSRRELETTQFATLFGFEVAWAHGELFVVHPPEDSGEEL